MRILIWPADEWACAHHRLLFPAGVLQMAGEDIVVDNAGPRCNWSEPWPGAPKTPPPASVQLLGLAATPDADIIVMQRPARRWWSDLIPHLKAAGIKVVVDVDDRYDRIDPRNANAFDTATSHVAPHWVDLACARADVVTATTPALAKRYGFGKGVVLPNLVPAQYLAVQTDHHRMPETIGWPGVVEHHPGDLITTEGGVAAAVSETGWRFRVPAGTGVGVAAELGLDAKLVQVGELCRFWEWSQRVAELEVGIVPLKRSDFNAAKSALKMLEISSLGIPVVVSPTPDNRRVHGLGIGQLAESRGQWYRHTRALMRSAEYRADLGGKAREVMQSLTYENHADRWLDAWTDRVSAKQAA